MSVWTQVIRKAGRLEAMEVAMLPARAALGASMIYHGLGKLRAPEPTGQYFESLGIRPGKPWALATGLAELTSGVLTVAGVGTRLASLMVLVTQARAIDKVHKSKGYDISKGGYEYNLALIAIALGMLVAGPGKPSVKSMLAHRFARRRRLPLVRSREPLAVRVLQ